jgi:hypothetical protein
LLFLFIYIIVIGIGSFVLCRPVRVIVLGYLSWNPANEHEH